MKKIAFILVALSCLLPVRAYAAVINGMLVDSQDTTGLIEATVKLLMANKDSTMVKGTTTDMNGVFNIKGVPATPWALSGKRCRSRSCWATSVITCAKAAASVPTSTRP